MLLLLYSLISAVRSEPRASVVAASANGIAGGGKLRLGLAALEERYREGGLARAEDYARQAHLPMEAGLVEVYVYTRGDRSADHGDALQAAGLLGLNTSQLSNLVAGAVPVSRLASLAELEEVEFVTPPSTVLPAAITEALSAIRATDYQAAGFDGSGTKIAGSTPN